MNIMDDIVAVRVEFGSFGGYCTKVHLPGIKGWIDPWLSERFADNLASASKLALNLEAIFQKLTTDE